MLRAFDAAFDCTVLEGYGLSETSPVASFNHPHRERKPGSIGTPIEGVEMRVLDDGGNDVPQGQVGEIAIRGHNIMKGYWQRPEETASAIPAGWFLTGDMGRVDEDGYYFIVDRKKDLIIRGGYNVYPREIEEVLYEHPGVAEAAVIGMPDPLLGEEVAAAVALKPGATVTVEELRDFVKAQVAAYKYPRHVWFVDALPKGPTGKILKRDIVASRPTCRARRGDARTVPADRRRAAGTAPRTSRTGPRRSMRCWSRRRAARCAGSCPTLPPRSSRPAWPVIPWRTGRRLADLVGELARIAAGDSERRTRPAGPAFHRHRPGRRTRCCAGCCSRTWPPAGPRRAGRGRRAGLAGSPSGCGSWSRTS